MTDFLLELLCEEIPARMQAKASEDLARLFTEKLAEAGLKPEKLTSYVTPRRLALIAHGLPLQTQAVSEEYKGPRTSAPEQALEGFLRKTGLAKDQLEDRDGVWFAVVEKPGRATADVLAEAVPAIIRAFPWPKSMRWGVASQTTESLRWVRPLQGIIALLGEGLVEMEVDGIRSGYTTVGHRFHHSGASPEKVGTGFSSGDATTQRATITMGSSHDYVDKLRACHVIVDQHERMAIIEQKAKAAAAAAGLSLIEDAGLVAENAGLTEWPVPLLGHFDPAFLEVPEEVIQLTLRINQKYFVLRDASGKLAPAFICTANIEAHDGGQAIVAGNGKVLAARLSDARFFWEQDKKTKLADHAQKLARITFHEKLGSVADKVERVAKLARWLVEQGIVTPTTVTPAKAGVSGSSTPTPEMPASAGMTKEELADAAELAARLCKADLVTEMVGEFPELQGLMGGYYARAEGQSDAVADAICDHYKPVGQGDDVPTAPVTVAVSLADKLDTIIHFFAVGLLPTGSKDPFALRRAALGVVALVLDNNLRFSLLDTVAGTYWGSIINWHNYHGNLCVFSELLDITSFGKDGEPVKRGGRVYSTPKDFNSWSDIMDIHLSEYPTEKVGLYWRRSDKKGASLYIDSDEIDREVAFLESVDDVCSQISSFFADRLKVQQKEAGVRHDLIDAVFALGGEDDLVRLLARVKALQGFVGTEDGVNLLAGYKRAANILKKEEVDASIAPAAPSEPAEIALVAALNVAEPQAAKAVEAEDFEAAMSALASLRAPIDAFFDHVTVNDADPAKRAARLALLERVRAAVHKVADFSRIEG